MSLKKKNNDEIDLIDLFIILWNGKLKIIFITILCAISMFIYLSNKKTETDKKIIFTFKTQIKPISVYEEMEYDMYNTLVKNLNSSDLYHIDKNKNLNLSTLIETTYISLINKKYLFDLYIEKLNEKSILMSAIEKYALINKKNYQNIENYKKDVKKLAYSIKLKKSLNNDEMKTPNWDFEFQTTDKKNWEKALVFINTQTNKEIKEFLRKKFDQQILQGNKIIKFSIEDIDNLILKSNNKVLNIDLLHINKKHLEMNFKKITRLKEAFYNSPIVKSDNFSAARMDFPSTTYIKQGSRSNSAGTLVFISVLIGLIFGILYTIIENSVRNRLYKKI